MTVLTAMKDKQVLVLGLGLTGLSCVQFLHAHGLSFAVNDSRDMPFTDEPQRDSFIKSYVQASSSLAKVSLPSSPSA